MRVAIAAVAVSILAASPALAQDAAAGGKQFMVCRSCHQIGPDAKNAVGPVLNGVVGRKAGSYPGYSYSDANKGSGLTWTAEELNRYLTSPQSVVPHTKMIFPGIKDETQRKDVITFLKQFGPDGQPQEPERQHASD